MNIIQITCMTTFKKILKDCITETLNNNRQNQDAWDLNPNSCKYNLRTHLALSCCQMFVINNLCVVVKA